MWLITRNLNFLKNVWGKEGAESWNTWRKKSEEIELDFTNIDFSEIDLKPMSREYYPINLDRVNLSGADLRDVHFSYVSLFAANFENANLKKADFDGQDLCYVDFSEAELSEANFYHANLSHTNFTNADLKGADLSDSNLSSAILRNADLRNTYLNGVDLDGADLSGADLGGTDLTSLSQDTSADYRTLLLTSHTNLHNTNLIGTNLSKASLSGLDLRQTDLREAILDETDLSNTELEGIDFNRKYFIKTDLRGANLRGVNLRGAILEDVNLSNAVLSEADLSGARLDNVSLSNAYLDGTNFESSQINRSDLSGAYLCKTHLSRSNLVGCRIYGIAAWDVELEKATQKDLIITNIDEPEITVDNLEVAQFIYLLLNNQKIRQVIDTITSKVVLILGYFTTERKQVLDTLNDELRCHNYSPVVFNLEEHNSESFIETARTLANMAHFVLIDLTDLDDAVQKELATSIFPRCVVPTLPFLLGNYRYDYVLFRDLQQKYSWVLSPHRYKDTSDLITVFQEQIIQSVEQKTTELKQRKPLKIFLAMLKRIKKC